MPPCDRVNVVHVVADGFVDAPVNAGRQERVVALIRALRFGDAPEVHAPAASARELEAFHDRAYVRCLEQYGRKRPASSVTARRSGGARRVQHGLGGGDDDCDSDDDDDAASDGDDDDADAAVADDDDATREAAGQSAREAFGLTHDCSLFRGVWEHVTRVAGGSLAGARLLVDAASASDDDGDGGEAGEGAASRTTPAMVFWFGGGRHHASRDRASGFCFVNDVVLAIAALQRGGLRRVLYVDLDLHHGDGVAEAFVASSAVLCVSMHYRSPGFFPGTGAAADVGIGRGHGFTRNVCLEEGASDDTMQREWQRVVEPVLQGADALFTPDAVVLVAGCDGLATDPHGVWNLTQRAFQHAVRSLRRAALPTLVLGGGGYHNASAARCWAGMVWAAVEPLERPLSEYAACDVPEHEFFGEYGPDFVLGVRAGVRRDRNASAS